MEEVVTLIIIVIGKHDNCYKDENLNNRENSDRCIKYNWKYKFCGTGNFSGTAQTSSLEINITKKLIFGDINSMRKKQEL